MCEKYARWFSTNDTISPSQHPDRPDAVVRLPYERTEYLDGNTYNYFVLSTNIFGQVTNRYAVSYGLALLVC